MLVLKLISQIHINSFFLQDMKSMKMIDLSSQVDGLYKLTRSLKPVQAPDLPFIHKHVIHTDSLSSFHITPQTSIWYFRLGHLFSHKLYDNSNCIHLLSMTINLSVTYVTFPNKRKIHTKLVYLMLLLEFPF